MKFLVKQTGDILTILIEDINNFNFKLKPPHNSTLAIAGRKCLVELSPFFYNLVLAISFGAIKPCNRKYAKRCGEFKI